MNFIGFGENKVESVNMAEVVESITEKKGIYFDTVEDEDRSFWLFKSEDQENFLRYSSIIIDPATWEEEISSEVETLSKEEVLKILSSAEFLVDAVNLDEEV